MASIPFFGKDAFTPTYPDGLISSTTANLMARQGSELAQTIERQSQQAEAGAKAPAIATLYTNALTRISAGDMSGFGELEKGHSLGVGNPFLEAMSKDASAEASRMAGYVLENKLQQTRIDAAKSTQDEILKRQEANDLRDYNYGIDRQHEKNIQSWQANEAGLKRQAEIEGKQYTPTPPPVKPPYKASAPLVNESAYTEPALPQNPGGINPGAPGLMPGDNPMPAPEFTPGHQLTELPPEATTKYGSRADGTPKGPGFLGELKRPDGNVSTELSIGVQIDGKETQIPSLVPTLNKSEINHLLSGGQPTPEIIQKATEHAKARLSEGKSPFASEQDAVASGPRPPRQDKDEMVAPFGHLNFRIPNAGSANMAVTESVKTGTGTKTYAIKPAKEGAGDASVKFVQAVSELNGLDHGFAELASSAMIAGQPVSVKPADDPKRPWAVEIGGKPALRPNPANATDPKQPETVPLTVSPVVGKKWQEAQGLLPLVKGLTKEPAPEMVAQDRKRAIQSVRDGEPLEEVNAKRKDFDKPITKEEVGQIKPDAGVAVRLAEKGILPPDEALKGKADKSKAAIKEVQNKEAELSQATKDYHKALAKNDISRARELYDVLLKQQSELEKMRAGTATQSYMSLPGQLAHGL